MSIRQAVIAVAGLGTRFLPATKVIPKELMPIVDLPVVQYLVEEAVDSGLDEIIFVTRPGTQSIAEHFEPARHLEGQVSHKRIADKLQKLNLMRQKANFANVHQAGHLPYGNGAPLLAAKSFLRKNEPFVYMFGDDLVLGQTPCVRQLMDTFEKYQPGAVVGVQSVPREETYRYGIVKPKPNTNPTEMDSIVEKPAPNEAPSTLAQFGRFVLSPRVVEILEHLDLGKDNELWLTDAIDQLRREQRVLVQEVEGKWLTIGDPLRFLIANVEYALADEEIGSQFASYLRTLKLPDQ